MPFPTARLEKFSKEEKKKLSVILRRKLIVRSAIFLFLILASAAIMIYFNKYSGNYKIEDNLEIINVVFVVVAALSGRLLVSEVRDYRREIASPDKKIVHAKITGRKGNKIMLGNKLFSKEDVLLDAAEFDSLNSDDNVRIEISARSNMLLGVKRI